MKFTPTPLDGAYLIDLDRRGDDRGFFARAFCKEEFAQAGLCNTIVQVNNSLSRDRGTLRGMHYQLPPFAEDKVVRCIRGALFDVMIDLRPDSRTYGKWYGAELTAENRTMMFVPKGFAHGFLTLAEDTEVFYLATQCYSPEHERGVRWNDPCFGVQWPIEPRVISEKDAKHPLFDLDNPQT